MRVSRLAFALASSLLSVAACGGDDPADPILIDAEVPPPPDATPPPPDAEPCLLDQCGNFCVDLDTDEGFCGSCSTSCNGGEECTAGVCACVEAYIPEAPTLTTLAISRDFIPGAEIALGVFGGAPTNALSLAYGLTVDGAVGLMVGQEYAFTMPPAGEIPAFPLLAAGYDVQFGGQPSATAAHVATGGTMVIDAVCVNGSGVTTGIAGRGTDVVFSAVDSFTNPTITPGGCSFTVPTLTFTFATTGTTCTAP
jgi:hypothetical protein